MSVYGHSLVGYSHGCPNVANMFLSGHDPSHSLGFPFGRFPHYIHKKLCLGFNLKAIIKWMSVAQDRGLHCVVPLDHPLACIPNPNVMNLVSH